MDESVLWRTSFGGLPKGKGNENRMNEKEIE
jgi:hypothetical protein